MLVHDGSPQAGHRQVSILWLGSCVNPAGDLYYGCYPALRSVLGQMSGEDLAAGRIAPALSELPIGFGTECDLAVPGDAISSKPRADGIVHPYGLVFAFFAACAGDLGHASGDPAGGLPVGCFRPDSHEALGQQDFEFGFFPVYVYYDFENQNPVVDGSTFSGASELLTCSQPSDCGPQGYCGSAGLCLPVVPSCGQDSIDDCPGYAYSPRVNPSSAQLAVDARTTVESAPVETIWVAYFATHGSFTKEYRSVLDPATGWGEFSSMWRASVPSGTEARLWAVVHDSRNGAAWTWQDVYVR